MLDSNADLGEKVLFRTRDSNKFDWHSLFTVFVGALFQFSIYASIILSFKMAIRADLNIGIAQAIWSMQPFFVSVLERCIYSVPFDTQKLFGMSALISCAILVSLSEVISPPATTGKDVPIVTPSIDDKIEKLPLWVAVLCSFVMPVVCTLNIIVIKHANETLKIAAKDFTIAYWLIMSLIFQINGVVYFAQNEGVFDLKLFLNGFIASFLNLIGCMFTIACFQTGAPIGPSCALISTQVIIVTIA